MYTGYVLVIVTFPSFRTRIKTCEYTYGWGAVQGVCDDYHIAKHSVNRIVVLSISKKHLKVVYYA